VTSPRAPNPRFAGNPHRTAGARRNRQASRVTQYFINTDSGVRRRYIRLTSSIKRIRTPSWHDRVNNRTDRSGRDERRKGVLGGAKPVGSTRDQRLDPLALPVRFTASDAGADERQRQVELDRERVVLRRAVRGIPMAVRLPISAFLGVALRVTAEQPNAAERVTLSLEHRDPALSVPLFAAASSEDVIAEWQLWSRVLGVPMLVSDADGSLRKPFTEIGAVRAEPPQPRRRRRNALRARRPSILMRRRVTRLVPGPVHRDEREIIARN
jgi:Family of unknown function (DUF6101)